MRVLKAAVSNFGSYDFLNFTFENQGLTLIEGPTGSGKSTLCDLVPWILFGKTAKGGNVGDVVSWGQDSIQGDLSFEINDKTYTIHRSRNPNDLYFAGAELERGKDNTDTQRLINELIGFDYDTYLLSAYYHELSESAGFFTAKAAARRNLIGQLVDLSFADEMKDDVTQQVKEKSKQKAKLEKDVEATEKLIAYIQKQISLVKRENDVWHAERTKAIENYLRKSETFEEDKQREVAKIESEIKTQAKIIENASDLSEALNDAENTVHAVSKQKTQCDKCGNSLNSTELHEAKLHLMQCQSARKAFKSAINRIIELEQQLTQAHLRKNTYAEQAETLAEEKNPHNISEHAETLHGLLTESGEMKKALDEINQDLTDLELLADFTANSRVAMIQSTVKLLEDRTNNVLSKHFDGEIQVQLSVESEDKIEALIMKDGNECVFTQLSKGQRQLLKFSFTLAVMTAVANKTGISPSTLFFDEAFDGLDENFKTKAFGALNELALTKESIFVVEHSESLKTMFSRKYTVSLINGVSTINEEA